MRYAMLESIAFNLIPSNWEHEHLYQNVIHVPRKTSFLSLGYGCLAPLSTICQLYRGGQ